ncbi:uncharacterized protein LOC135207171 [Macrobrachium nipponense]|uniref:uncharacterized protein LOC135207171 n=1 Tax=Macrobrachium nipponense TaxID=159736 RepID=UPI0030C8C433
MLSNNKVRYWNLLRDNATITVLKASTLCNQTSGFTQLNGVGCILIGRTGLSWNKARDFCHAADSELFNDYDSPQPVYNAIWSEIKRILPTSPETNFRLWFGKRGDYWLKDSWWIDANSTLPCTNLQFNRTLADYPCNQGLWFLCQQMFT